MVLKLTLQSLLHTWYVSLLCLDNEKRGIECPVCSVFGVGLPKADMIEATKVLQLGYVRLDQVSAR